MARALMIDEGVQAQIAQALKEAPTIPLEALKRYGRKARASASDPLPLADRTAIEKEWQRPPSAEVLIPHGYRLCISREEQPPGLTVLHLSVSVDGKPGMMPSVPAVEMLARECGAVWPPFTYWPEEYEPGRWAVNILAEEEAR